MSERDLFKIYYTERAELEIAKVLNWYEDKRKGLGSELLDEIDVKLNLIKLFPEMFPVKNKRYRMVRLKKFPYLLTYSVNEKKKTVHVVSLFHIARKSEKSITGKR